MKNKIICLIAAVLVMAVFGISSFATNYYSSDESGDKTVPDSIASISVSEEGVSIPESAMESTYELTPEGNLTLVDDYYEQSESDDISQKQFLTVTTKAGNTFYIIVDRDGNEDNVYLLNLVDEADLMALINDEEVTITTTKEPETTEKAAEESSVENDEVETDKSNGPKLFFLVIVLGGGGFAYYWFKVRGTKGKTKGLSDSGKQNDEDKEYDIDTYMEGNANE